MPTDERGDLANLETVEDAGRLVLSDVLNHIFDKGIVIRGSVIIGIADMDLVKVSLGLVISSVESELQHSRRGRDTVRHGDVSVLPPAGEE